MRSTDPSPWAEEPSPWDDDEYAGETTKENVARSEREAIEAEREEFWNGRIWDMFSRRLAKDGTLIR